MEYQQVDHNTYNKKLYDAMFGLAIGDALGVPYEFKRRGTFVCQDMTGYGTHHQPEGTWSDDTSMALATLKSLKDRNGKVDLKDIRKNFLAWLNDSAFTANGELFDIGNATYRALRTGRSSNGVRDNGNGSLMRILPLAFVDCTDDEIRAVSSITHGHWISTEACVIYVHIARRLMAGEHILDIIPTLKYDKPFDRLYRIHELDRSEIRSSGYVVDTLEAALWCVSHAARKEDLAPDQMKANGADASDQVTAYAGATLDQAADHDSATSNHVTAYEPDTSQQVKSHESNVPNQVRNFRTDVLEAVNLGDDTDTVGAVTGGLAGIIYGLGNSEEQWMKKLRNKDLIQDCLFDEQ